MFWEFLIYFSSFVGLFTLFYYLLSIHGKDISTNVFSDNLPFVSIIIPAFNEESSIKDTIVSALNLDYPRDKLEILVVNDGSKDNTLSLAREIRDARVRVFDKENGGKATALNFGIDRSKGDFVVTMDADTFVEAGALKKMIPFFSDDSVMCVTPSMAINNPKGILGRVQQIEYLLGVFLRKAFSSINAIHVTPGAFSAYRKSFFENHGGFEVGNMTEDMEMALRIQSKGYKLECSDRSVAYTNCPTKFYSLLKQRRRWYYGWTDNLLRYSHLFSRKYGNLGVIVLPAAVVSIVAVILLTFYIVFSTFSRIRSEFLFYESINFDLQPTLSVSKLMIERYVFLIFSEPLSWIFLISVVVLLGILFFAKRRVKMRSGVILSIPFFLFLFSILLTLWWVVSIFYYFIVGKTVWR